MWKKVNNILTIIMGSSIGVFIGHSIYLFWDYRKYPDLYAMQSAPWYTSIFVYGIFTIIVLIVAIIIKRMIRSKVNEVVH